jgi:glycosyltransferase involved in cell wall biosynthesis
MIDEIKNLNDDFNNGKDSESYEETINDLIKDNEDLKSRIDQLIELINAMRKDHREIYASGSWKLTSPIRGAINLFTLGRLEGDIPEYLKENNIFEPLLVTEKKTDDVLKEYDEKYNDAISNILKQFNPKPWEITLLDRISRLKRDIDSRKKIVIHLYDKADASTFRYACYNVCQYTSASDKYRAHYFFSDECESVRKFLDNINLLVFCRTKWRIPYGELLKEAKTKGIKVVMQIDDLVCSVDYIHYLLEMNLDHKGTDFIYDAWFANVTRLEWIAREVDGFIVTNDFLGERLKETFGKDYAVIRNSLNKEQIEISEKIMAISEKGINNKKFVIGYFSGSPTHKRDLSIIIDDIMRLLDTYDDIEFVIVGYMDLPRRLQKYVKSGKIRFKPLVNFLELQYLISQVDVNVVPLEDTLFTNCKSELKFFEAAIAGTITVASPSYTYKNAITDKEDGFLCEPGQWYQTIADIHDGIYDIDDMLAKARKKVLDRYANQNVIDEIENAYNKYLQ